MVQPFESSYSLVKEENPLMTCVLNILIRWEVRNNKINNNAYGHYCAFLFCFNYSNLFLGQRLLHYKSDVLETVVLVNPSEENINIEVIFPKTVLFACNMHYFNIK